MLKAIFFDFDGVIIDSKEATIAYFQETFRHFRLPVPTKKDFTGLLGLKTIDIVKRLLPQLSDTEIQPIYEYSKEMSFKYVPRITLIDGVEVVLKNLKRQFRLGLVTSRGKRTVDVLLDKYHLRQYFDVVIDREDVMHHKPYPEGIQKTMKELGVNTSETIYIGDTQEDIEASANAGIVCVLIGPDNFKFKAAYKIDTLDELPILLGSII